MECLNCGQTMVQHLIQKGEDSITYEFCEGCQSLWLDKDELDKMAYQVEGSIEFSSKEPAPESDVAERECPNCRDTPLSGVYFLEYTDVLLDYCEFCEGFWLDGGELARINRELEKIMEVRGKGFSKFIENIHKPYYRKRIQVTEVDRKEQEQPPIKDAKKTGETEMDCPVCTDVTLDSFELSEVEFNGCPECRGVWFGSDRLRQIKDRVNESQWNNPRFLDDEVEALETAKTMHSDRNCPSCEESEMSTVHFGDSKILIEFCPECNGTWLDAMEFNEIAEYYEDRFADMDPEEAREVMMEELGEIWGGPEGTLSEIKDAVKSVSAFLNISLLSDPKLTRAILETSQNMRKYGLS